MPLVPRELDVAAFVKELGDDTGGQSDPVVVIADADDAPQYLLKTQNTGQGPWDSMFVQEMLAAHIADFLGVPIPDCAIINVDKEFIQAAPSLQFRYHFKPGRHFASKYFDDAENNLKRNFAELLRIGKPYTKRSWRSFFEGISNPQDAAKIIVFDLLTGNFDRFGNFGNLLIAKRNGTRTMFAIDHGHCFYKPVWCQEKIDYLQHKISEPTKLDFVSWFIQQLHLNRGMPYTIFGQMFNVLSNFVHIEEGINPFEPVVRKIMVLNESIIEHWFATIPEEWFVAGRAFQMNLYKHYILKQREIIPAILDNLAVNGAFDDHVGGVLEWNVKATGTQ